MNNVSTVVYYFTGTGNSLAVAKGISRGLQAALVPMAWNNVTTDADRIGLVFPAYMAQLYGIPLIVERFIRKIKGIDSKYIFIVCTCGGLENFNGLPTIRNVNRLVRSLGGKVSAEYSIRLPMNTMDYSHIPVPIDQDLPRMFGKCSRKIEDICRTVVNRAKSRYRASKVLLNLLMTPLYLMLHAVYYKELKKNAKEPMNSPMKYYELMPLIDKSIYSDEKCKGCSICANICPVGNIEMIDKKPIWQHHCEICLACAEWCPNKAVHHCYRVEGKTYRHPQVELNEMLEQARGRGP
jgi:formate hydrogenlyase subunit 6/NADH:ubiquinone oxidoreductase subunit I